MAAKPEKNPLDIMLENLTPEQKIAVDVIAHEKNISIQEALLEKIRQEREENLADLRERHAP